MKLDPGAGVLSFDVISLLAIDPDGVEDESRKRILKRLFRPGIFNEVTLLAFVQTCDSVYKRLRYFRASVGNSSVIDQVLEQIIDGVFYFVLLLSILCLLKYNPWTLLVSLSTLLFSTAFAIGPSLSRYIEGVLMIIARRPYDLGDRIFMVGSDAFVFSFCCIHFTIHSLSTVFVGLVGQSQRFRVRGLLLVC
jgi:small-conductance mechanosensitive channel